MDMMRINYMLRTAVIIVEEQEIILRGIKGTTWITSAADNIVLGIVELNFSVIITTMCEDFLIIKLRGFLENNYNVRKFTYDIVEKIKEDTIISNLRIKISEPIISSILLGTVKEKYQLTMILIY